ncbi:hypothetical protein TSA66_05785 [Noviherbaspirillum autotrophicum]|uniref:Uncharacterized protein n=1 Tax=Noviherbaspirillum autotrophicum TaxID=709839 RepID=A0A0C1Y0A1_9BURK|nr:hypothetical protein TSA66_05785 [Noviherbaspirillum autotrophicum]
MDLEKWEHRSHGSSAHYCAALAIAFLLHYLLTPAEVAHGQGSMPADQIRAVAGGLCAFVAGLGAARETGFYRLVPPLMLLSAWILLTNWPPVSWYVLASLAFIWFGAVIAAGLVHGSLRPLLLRSLDFLLAAWLISFAVQFALYIGWGAVIDVHQIFHPYSEARISSGWDDGLLRMTGVHIEPGTYSNWMYGLVFLRGLARRRFFDFFSVVAIASTLLTFSFWGILSASIYLFAACMSSLSVMRSGTLVKLLGIAVVLAGTYAFVADLGMDEVAEYLYQRSTMGDSSGDSKLRAYDGFLREFDEVLVFGKPLDHDFCEGCESPQDAGVLLNAIILLGLPVSLAVFGSAGYAAYAIGRLPGLLAYLPLLFGKFYVYEPILWLIFCTCILTVCVLRESSRRLPKHLPSFSSILPGR